MIFIIFGLQKFIIVEITDLISFMIMKQSS